MSQASTTSSTCALVDDVTVDENMYNVEENYNQNDYAILCEKVGDDGRNYSNLSNVEKTKSTQRRSGGGEGVSDSVDSGTSGADNVYAGINPVFNDAFHEGTYAPLTLPRSCNQQDLYTGLNNAKLADQYTPLTLGRDTTKDLYTGLSNCVEENNRSHSNASGQESFTEPVNEYGEIYDNPSAEPETYDSSNENKRTYAELEDSDHENYASLQYPISKETYETLGTQ